MHRRCLHRAVACSLPRHHVQCLVHRRLITSSGPSSSANDAAFSSSAVEDMVAINPGTPNLNDSSSAMHRAPDKQPHGQILQEFIEETRKHTGEQEQDTEASRHIEPAGIPSHHSVPSYSICVVPEMRALNMPGMFTVLREFEKKFGRLCEFRFIRDKDSPSDYLKAIFIRFYDKESLHKVREALSGQRTGTILIGNPPEWDRLRDLDGGVGLNDIHTLLRPATPQADDAAESHPDKEVEHVVDSVEKALQSEATESEPESSVDTEQASSPPTTGVPDAIFPNPCECKIEIHTDGFESIPLHEKIYFGSQQRRINIARSFVQWGGFYPNYRFAEYDEKTQGGATEIPETVRTATRDMRLAILNYRRQLRSFDQPDHGLEIHDGKDVVVNWEESHRSDDQQEHVLNVDGIAQDPVASSSIETAPRRDASAAPSAQNAPVQPVAETAGTKWQKPKALTREEEGSLARLFARSSSLRTRVQTNSEQDSTTERETSYTEASSASSAPLTHPSSAPATSESHSQPTNVADGDPGESELSSTSSDVSPSSASPSATSSEEQTSDSQARQAQIQADNNRARRARRKAELERAGFKAKLLGWLGR